MVDLANFEFHGCGCARRRYRRYQNPRGQSICTARPIRLFRIRLKRNLYEVAAAATNGDVLVKTPCHTQAFESITAKLVAAGATVEEFDDAVRVTRSGPLKKINLKTPAPSRISDGSAAADGE